MVAERLLEVLATDPDDPAPWSIYGDLLQSEGNPRGELILLMLERERNPTKRLFEAQQRVIAEHWTALVPAALAKRDGMTWRRGFVADLQIATPEELVELPAEPSLRFVESATLAIDGNQWDAWCDAFARRTLRWRRLRVEIANSPDDLELAPLLAAFPAVETLRIRGEGLVWTGVRAPALTRLALVDAGEVGAIEGAELPMLRELHLLGESSATEELCACPVWGALDDVILAEEPPVDATDPGPTVRVSEPIDRDVDRETNAFIIVGAPIEAPLLLRLAAQLSGVQLLSARIAALASVPRFTAIQLYGTADDQPFGLAAALEAVLSPAPPIALAEVDETQGRYLVLGKSPARGDLGGPDELVRRAVDLAIGRDPGPGILDDIVDALAAAPDHGLVSGRSTTILNVIDPSAAPLIEPEDDDPYDDDDHYDDDDYDHDHDFDDGLELTYVEPVVTVEDRVADLEAFPEPDGPPIDEDQEPFEPTEHDALDQPEVWFEFRDHWDDRCVDPNDEPNEQVWLDPEYVWNELALDLDRQVATPACVKHGCAIETCQRCSAPLCVECQPTSRDDTCAACMIELDDIERVALAAALQAAPVEGASSSAVKSTG